MIQTTTAGAILRGVKESQRVLEILRVAYRDDGTFGVLLDRGRERDLLTAGEPFAVTCEEVWRHNEPRVSCIPAGEYLCRRVKSPKFGDTFEIVDVPGRSAILWHPGNTIEDTEGCVLTGEGFNPLRNKTGVDRSRVAFDELMARLAGVDEFTVIVRDA